MAATEKRPELIEIARGLKDVPMSEEYEKMISGMMYNPLLHELQAARHRCRGRTADFNNVDTREVPYEKIADVRHELLQKLVGKVGKNTFIEPPFLPDYGCNVVIGENVFINWNCSVLDTSLIVIGDRAMIGTNVSLLTAGHDTSVLSRRKYVEFGHPIFIEQDCWIGANVVVLPGVRIGEGSTIGAGSIVTRNIPPFSVAVGSPCKVIRTIKSADEEEKDPNNQYRDLPSGFDFS